MNVHTKSLESSSPRVADVVAALRNEVPPTLAIAEERDWPLLLCGSIDSSVSAVAVCWAPTEAALEEAASLGADLVVSHEGVFYEHQHHDWWDEAPEGEKLPNRRRREVLVRHGITLLRLHSAVDGWRSGGTVAATARLLGFEGEGHWDGSYIAAYDIHPRSLRELAEETKTRLLLPAIRVSGDPGRVIRRVALAVGGNGLWPSAVEPCLRLRAEAVIFGELIEHTWYYAQECGIAVIETTHAATEDGATAELARVIQSAFPEVPVHSLVTGMPWWAP